MRALIAAMKMSVDGKILPPDGQAHWVRFWSDDYGLTPQIDACLLGAGMYPEYEAYWTAIQDEPEKPIFTDDPPSAGEVAWAQFCTHTPHYVLSTTLNEARWPQTRFLRGLNEVAALKQETGKAIYLMGGAHVTANLLEARLVDELRVIIYPVIAGGGLDLFEHVAHRHDMSLQDVHRMDSNRVRLVFGVAR